MQKPREMTVKSKGKKDRRMKRGKMTRGKRNKALISGTEVIGDGMGRRERRNLGRRKIKSKGGRVGECTGERGQGRKEIKV